MPKAKTVTQSAFDRWYRKGRRKVARKTVDAVKPEDAEKVRALLAQRVRLLAREKAAPRTEKQKLRDMIADIERTLARLGETWDTVKDGPFSEFLTAHGLNLPGLGDDDEALEIPPMVGKQEGFGKDKAFNKPYWTKDSMGPNWTGMRGSWFLSAKYKRTKDGARWVSQAKHKDTGERRIGGMFMSVVDAQDAAARLAVDAGEQEPRIAAMYKKLRGLSPEQLQDWAKQNLPGHSLGGKFSPAYARKFVKIALLNYFSPATVNAWWTNNVGMDSATDAGDPKKIAQIKADMTKVRQKIATLRGSDPEQIKELQFILQNLQGDLDEEMTGDREI